MDDQKVLARKSVLITGAAQGLGKSFAELFLEQGATFIYLVDVNEELGKKTEQYFLIKYPGKVLFIHCDVTIEDNLIKTYEKVEETDNGLDVVINCAGICNEAFPLQTVDINVRGLIQSSLLAWNKMRRDKGCNGGTIVNMASVAALSACSFMPVYCASKAGVMLFGRCLGHEDHYVNTGVRVVTMCFGSTATNIIGESSKTITDTDLSVPFLARLQSVESATKGFQRMFENGASGSVWLSENDDQATDITERIQKAYDIMYTY